VESVATLGGDFTESKAGAPSVQIHSGTRQNHWRHRLASMAGGGGPGPAIAIEGGLWWTRCQGWVSSIGRKMRARWVQEAGRGSSLGVGLEARSGLGDWGAGST
jgi:hypothetical protein